MVNYAIVLILAAALTAAITYIVKAKKRGVKCIGCSACGSCLSENNSAETCTCGCRDVSKTEDEIKCRGCSSDSLDNNCSEW